MRLRRQYDWLVLAVLACALVPAASAEQTVSTPSNDPAEISQGDWPQFRGPDRTGISAMTGLKRSWPEAGPTVLWRRPLGEGYAGIAVAGEHLYTLFAVDDEEFAASFRVADGEEVWRVKIGSKLVDEWGNGPRATPTVDGDRVFVLSSFGNLLALGRDDGEIFWRLAFKERFGHTAATYNMAAYVPDDDDRAPSPEFDHSSSPLVIDDSLIVYTGAGNGKSMAALDKATGETLWTSLDTLGSHSSPILASVGGERQIVMVVPNQIVSVSVTGEPLWNYPWAPATPTQPVLTGPGQIFSTSVFDFGAKLLTVGRGEGGDFGIDVAWEYRLMRNAWASAVYHGGHIYGFDNATLKCLDAETGEMKWRKRGLGRGSLVLADDLLIVLSDQGLLSMAEVSPEGYEEGGRLEVLSGRTLQAPTPAQGKLFLRSHKEMVAIDLVH